MRTAVFVYLEIYYVFLEIYDYGELVQGVTFPDEGRRAAARRAAFLIAFRDGIGRNSSFKNAPIANRRHLILNLI
jgi:hypothetical protein